MSWIEKEKSGYKITTGDGAVYLPYTLTASWNQEVEPNIAIFNFPNVQKSKVHRGTNQGARYNVELKFQGDDNLDVAASFRASCNNRKPWVVVHPFYGQMVVQPVSAIKYDNSALNVTTISFEMMETISGVVLKPLQTSTDAVTAAGINNKANFNNGYANNVPVIQASGLAKLQSNITNIYQSVISKIAAVQADIDTYKNYYYQANAVLNTAIYDTMQIVSAATDLATAPAWFVDTVINRINMFQAQYDVLSDGVLGLLGVLNTATSPLKRQYETMAGVSITGMCIASVNNITTDYDYMPDVLTVIGIITDNYNAYLQNLYSLQTANGGEPDSYIPDADSITNLEQLVFNTIAALYTIASQAKQQRIYTLPQDDNILTIAYKLYPATDTDIAANQLIANNNIGMNELFVIKQGREIIYYV